MVLGGFWVISDGFQVVLGDFGWFAVLVVTAESYSKLHSFLVFLKTFEKHFSILPFGNSRDASAA